MICYYLPQEKVRQQNKELLEQEQLELLELKRQQDEVQYILLALEDKRKNLSVYVAESRAQAEEDAKIFFEKEMQFAQEHLDRALEKASVKYQQDEESYRQEYLATIKEFAIDLQKKLSQGEEEYNILQTRLQELRDKTYAAVEAAKREEELRVAQNFYRLVLSDTDLQEIQYLRQVAPFLKDKEALNKVIWKVYYEKPYTDLIGRIIGSEIKTGIYKITNINNQMCYIGQAVNIAERWRQHIKRAVGAEAPTRNKLYPAMAEIGPENFTFEIVEICERAVLDEREDYWQDYFKAKEFGYSIK